MATSIRSIWDVGESDRRFASFLSEIDLGALMLDRDGRVVFINDHLLALLERGRDEMLGSDWMDVVPAVQRSALRQVYLDAVASETSPGSREDSIVTRRGHQRRLAWTSVVQHDADGEVAGLAAIGHDVTDLRRSEADRALLSLAVEQTADAVVVTDAAANIVFVNAAYEVASGFSSAEMVGQRPASFAKQGTDPVARDLWMALSREQPWRGDVRSCRKNGSEYINAMSITPVFDDNDRLSAYVSVQRDVSRLREIESDLRLEAAVRTRLGHASQQCGGASTLEGAAQKVCDELATLADIDRVQVVAFASSDHAAVVAANGDGRPSQERLVPLPGALVSGLLERTALGSWGTRQGFDRGADQLSAALLGADMKAVAYGAIRRGDDIVGVVVAGTSDGSKAAAVADKLAPLIGFGASSNAVLLELLELNRHNHELRVALELMLTTSGFWTLFQPIVEIATGRTTGYEALTRFANGERPDVCFAQAWSVGLGAELEMATLEMAISTARRLPPGRFLDLNISPRLLVETSSVRRLLQCADRPVVLEITEHERIDDYSALRRASAALGQEVRLAVDDAGVGIANFSHIIELRPDFVKLDASLVRGVNADAGRQALVAAMVEFARTAGCHLIAEGVETEEEAAEIAQLGVALAQGYHFDRPHTAEHWAAG